MSNRFAPANHKFELHKNSTNVRESFFPTGRQSHPYLVRARLAVRKASLLIPALTPPNPHAKLAGAFVIRAGIVASFSKPSSDYARRDKDGTALWRCPINPTRKREPQKSVPCLFKILEAASRSGIPVGRSRVQSASSRSSVIARIGDDWVNSGGEWTVRMEGSRIVFPGLEKRSGCHLNRACRG